MQAFISELRRRNVLRVAAFYAAAGWLLVQVATQVFPFFDVSNGVVRLVVVAIILGFPAALLFSWFYELTPEGLKLESQIPPGASITRQTGRKIDRSIIAVLALAVVLLIADKLALWKSAAPAVAAAPAAGNDKSIAVLPFENLSDDKANAYFASGIQDEILTRLAKIGALKVISRTSTAHDASHPGNLPEIAAKLGVANILEGSVEKVGGKVRINVQLIRAADDNHLWAEIYDRSADDILGVQGEVAAAIAGAMNAKLSGAEQQQLAQKPTQVPAAYEAYLRGLASEQHFAFGMAAANARLAAYARATELDPNFAAAWARLASARVNRYFSVAHTPAVLAEARQALEQAQRLAPGAAETLAAEGLYQYWGLADYEQAAERYSRALQASPNSSEWIAMLAHVRRRQGRWQEALRLDQRAIELDPLNSNYLINLAATLRALRRYDEAIQALDRAGLAVVDDPVPLSQKVLTEQMQGELEASAPDAERLPLDSDDMAVLLTRFNQWHLQRNTARGIAEMRQVLQRREHLDDGLVANLLEVLGAEESLAGLTGESQGHLRESRDLIRSMMARGNDDPNLYGELAQDESLLGDTQAALRDAAASVDKVAHDAFSLPDFELSQALVMLRAGDRPGAIARIGEALRLPAAFDPTLPLLRLDPLYDPLRQEPAFQKLLADPPPPLRLDG